MDPNARNGSPGFVYTFRQQNEDSSSGESITLSSCYILFQQKQLYDRHYSFEQAMPLWGKPCVLTDWRKRIERPLFKKICSS